MKLPEPVFRRAGEPNAELAFQLGVVVLRQLVVWEQRSQHNGELLVGVEAFGHHLVDLSGQGLEVQALGLAVRLFRMAAWRVLLLFFAILIHLHGCHLRIVNAVVIAIGRRLLSVPVQRGRDHGRLLGRHLNNDQRLRRQRRRRRGARSGPADDLALGRRAHADLLLHIPLAKRTDCPKRCLRQQHWDTVDDGGDILAVL
mmetsp:Transcript_46010/g.133992  ORF Transcript_46010/g.133992 Transcript_46010/m.133992 type:complete len:200 (-) Transcript_46010:145-744(-)